VKSMNSKRVALNLLMVVSASVLMTGCIGGDGSLYRSRYASSVPDFLYPRGGSRITPEESRLARLLQVGIVFVPGRPAETIADSYFHDAWRNPGRDYRHDLPEELRKELLEGIAAEFRSHASIKAVHVLPSSCLMMNGGFANLDGVRRKYGVDVVALLSWDQVHQVRSGALSATYWTFVGMLLVPGEKSETSTMLDTAVVDIAGRRMLFRAPGTSDVRSRSTPPSWPSRIKKDSARGFRGAAEDLVVRLQEQLKRFEAKAAMDGGK